MVPGCSFKLGHPNVFSIGWGLKNLLERKFNIFLSFLICCSTDVFFKWKYKFGSFLFFFISGWSNRKLKIMSWKYDFSFKILTKFGLSQKFPRYSDLQGSSCYSNYLLNSSDQDKSRCIHEHFKYNYDFSNYDNLYRSVLFKLSVVLTIQCTWKSLPEKKKIKNIRNFNKEYLNIVYFTLQSCPGFD